MSQFTVVRHDGMDMWVTSTTAAEQVSMLSRALHKHIRPSTSSGAPLPGSAPPTAAPAAVAAGSAGGTTAGGSSDAGVYRALQEPPRMATPAAAEAAAAVRPPMHFASGGSGPASRDPPAAAPFVVTYASSGGAAAAAGRGAVAGSSTGSVHSSSGFGPSSSSVADGAGDDYDEMAAAAGDGCGGGIVNPAPDSVKVDTPFGTILDIKATKGTTIWQIKQQVQVSTRVPPGSQRLYCCWRELPDHLTLDKAEVKLGYMLRVLFPEHQVPQPRKGCTIMVKAMSGQEMVFPFDGGMCVIELKQLLYREGQAPVEIQRLVHGGKQLQDTRTLGEENVAKDHVIHLILNLRGC